MADPPVVIYGIDRHRGLGLLVEHRLPGVSVREYDTSYPCAVAADAEIVITRPGPFVEALFAETRCVRWMHSTAVGADRMLFPAMVASDVLLTNSRGCYDDTVANHALALVFALLRRLPATFEAQRARRWQHVHADEITGRTAGVVGFGSVGRAVAGRLRAVGARVLAADLVPPGADAPCDGFIDASDGLPRQFLETCDILVLTCPLTPRTRGMINGRVLAAMKRTAFLVNIARGPVVVEEDLIGAVQSGRIAGAALDVVAEEPLSPESPLWDLPGVIITPHMGWSSPLLEGRLADLIAANYRRYVRGEPLLNLVDKRAGY